MQGQGRRWGRGGRQGGSRKQSRRNINFARGQSRGAIAWARAGRGQRRNREGKSIIRTLKPSPPPHPTPPPPPPPSGRVAPGRRIAAPVMSRPTSSLAAVGSAMVSMMMPCVRARVRAGFWSTTGVQRVQPTDPCASFQRSPPPSFAPLPTHPPSPNISSRSSITPLSSGCPAPSPAPSRPAPPLYAPARRFGMLNGMHASLGAVEYARAREQRRCCWCTRGSRRRELGQRRRRPCAKSTW